MRHGFQFNFGCAFEWEFVRIRIVSEIVVEGYRNGSMRIISLSVA